MSEAETASFINIMQNVSNSGKNQSNSGKNKSNSGKNHIKENKVNKSKVKEIKAFERFERFWSCYPLDKNRAAAEKAYCDVILSGIYSEDDLLLSARNYAEYCKITGTDKIYHACNFLEKAAFEDYLPGKYKKPNSTRKNSFNDFKQNDYDFEQLEKELV